MEGIERLLDISTRANGEDVSPVSLDTFYAFLPRHAYIYVPTGELWPATSVDARLPKIGRCKASKWFDQNKAVQQITWSPGEPQIIKNKFLLGGGWKEYGGARCYNLYIPPLVNGGDAAQAKRWIEHAAFVYPDTHSEIIRFLAFKAQHPEIKINHALVLGGVPGIGKDTLVEPARRAVGYWNTKTVQPPALLGRFNGFLKSVFLFISEARDLGEINRYQFYEHLKPIVAAPPETIEIDEKNLREYSIPNLVAVVVTTNHKDAIAVPPDDRRYLVNWSPRVQADFLEQYWRDLWSWYEDGGFDHVAAYLRGLDLSDFNPKSPPPKTTAFWEFVDASRAPENAELADILDALGNPRAVTAASVLNKAEELTPVDKKRDGQPLPGTFAHWLTERKNRKQIARRFADCGYVPVQNPDTADRLWRIDEKRQIVFARQELTARDQLAAADRLRGPSPTLIGLG
jgi:hypothetical protein